MKLDRLLIGLFVLLLTVTAVGATWVAWDRSHTLYPTSETESTFLKSYTPKSVIEHFDLMAPSSYTQHNGGGAGREFVSRNAGFEWFLVLRPEKWTPLMNALRDDVSEQLAHDGGQVLSQSGNPQDGFQFSYKIDKSIGSLTISPLTVTSLIHRKTPLCKGMEDVSVRIEQRETWFPKEPGTIQISFNNSSH